VTLFQPFIPERASFLSVPHSFTVQAAMKKAMSNATSSLFVAAFLWHTAQSAYMEAGFFQRGDRYLITVCFLTYKRSRLS